MHVLPATGLTFILEKQLQGVDAMRLREVPLVWFGMAEVRGYACCLIQHGFMLGASCPEFFRVPTSLFL